MERILGVALLLASPLAFAAMPSIRELVWDVVKIIGVGMIFGLLYFLIGAAPFINETFKKAGQYLVILVAVLVIIYVILGLLGL